MVLSNWWVVLLIQIHIYSQYDTTIGRKVSKSGIKSIKKKSWVIASRIYMKVSELFLTEYIKTRSHEINSTIVLNKDIAVWKSEGY